MAGRERTGKLHWRGRSANHGRKPTKGRIKSQFKLARQSRKKR